MMDVLLAAPDLVQEPDLVVRAPAHGIRVLRRCVDAVDLLAAAAADVSVTAAACCDAPATCCSVVARMLLASPRSCEFALRTCPSSVFACSSSRCSSALFASTPLVSRLATPSVSADSRTSSASSRSAVRVETK